MLKCSCDIKVAGWLSDSFINTLSLSIWSFFNFAASFLELSLRNSFTLLLMWTTSSHHYMMLNRFPCHRNPKVKNGHIMLYNSPNSIQTFFIVVLVAFTSIPRLAQSWALLHQSQRRVNYIPIGHVLSILTLLFLVILVIMTFLLVDDVCQGTLCQTFQYQIVLVKYSPSLQIGLWKKSILWILKFLGCNRWAGFSNKLLVINCLPTNDTWKDWKCLYTMSTKHGHVWLHSPAAPVHHFGNLPKVLNNSCKLFGNGDDNENKVWKTYMKTMVSITGMIFDTTSFLYSHLQLWDAASKHFFQSFNLYFHFLSIFWMQKGMKRKHAPWIHWQVVFVR